MSIRKAACVNTGIASLVLALNCVVFLGSVTLRGTSIEFLRFPLALALAGLPPLQTVASIALLLSKSEARRRPVVWFLLLVIALSLVSAFFVLVGIGGTMAAP